MIDEGKVANLNYEELNMEIQKKQELINEMKGKEILQLKQKLKGWLCIYS